MNPKSFTIVFGIILALMILSSSKDLEKSQFSIMKAEEIVITTELQSAECSRTKILTEALLRRQYKEDSYAVTCKPLNDK